MLLKFTVTAVFIFHIVDNSVLQKLQFQILLSNITVQMLLKLYILHTPIISMCAKVAHIKNEGTNMKNTTNRTKKQTGNGIENLELEIESANEMRDYGSD